MDADFRSGYDAPYLYSFDMKQPIICNFEFFFDLWSDINKLI